MSFSASFEPLFRSSCCLWSDLGSFYALLCERIGWIDVTGSEEIPGWDVAWTAAHAAANEARYTAGERK